MVGWTSRWEKAAKRLRSAFINAGHNPAVEHVRAPSVVLSATRPGAVSCLDCGYHQEIRPDSDWYGGGQCSGRPPVTCVECRVASSESDWRFETTRVEPDDVPPQDRIKVLGLFNVKMVRQSQTCPECGHEQVWFRREIYAERLGPPPRAKDAKPYSGP